MSVKLYCYGYYFNKYCLTYSVTAHLTVSQKTNVKWNVYKENYSSSFHIGHSSRFGDFSANTVSKQMKLPDF